MVFVRYATGHVIKIETEKKFVPEVAGNAAIRRRMYLRLIIGGILHLSFVLLIEVDG